MSVTCESDIDLDGPFAPTRPGPHRRLGVLTCAGVVVVAVLFLPLAALTRGAPASHRGWPGSDDVTVILGQDAVAAEWKPVPGLRAGEARYLAAEQFSLEVVLDAEGRSHVLEQRMLTEEWVPADPGADWLQRVQGLGPPAAWDSRANAYGAGDPVPPSEWRGRCGAYYPTPDQDPCARPGLWEDPTPAFVAALPQDPRALAERLRADAVDNGRDSVQAALELATQALDRGLLPARESALLYRALAFLPGLAVTERRTVLGGRAGIALGIDADGEVLELIIDPLTGGYLGQRRRLTAARDGLETGRVTEQTTVTSRTVAGVGGL